MDTNEKILDINFLVENGVDINKSLELFGDINTYNETIGEFLVSSREKLNKLNEAKNSNNMHDYSIYAHSLKSDAKYFGFTKLAELAFSHETNGNNGDVSYIYQHYDELINEVNRCIVIVKNYIAGTRANGSGVSSNCTDISNNNSTINGEVYNNKTILVVDDSNIVRNFVKRIFSDKYNVGTAVNGEEAINIIEANRNNQNIVAILLDLNMPKVDGFHVLDFMKNNNLFTDMPVSIISGDSTKDTINKAFTYQIVDMLGKPFNEIDVKRVIERTMFFKEMNK